MIIFYNSNIISLNKFHPNASAMIIDGDRIAAVGDAGTLLEQVPGDCKKIDLGGRSIIPGFTDSHIHTLQYAQSLTRIDCETDTKGECLERVAERVRSTKEGQWIIGHGWNQNFWQEGYGTRNDLDLISTVHPIYLTSKSLHASWANTSALKLAGILNLTTNPEGGIIQRDEHGQPTGILFDNAIPRLEMHIPPPSSEEVITTLLEGQRRLLAYGITCVHDFDRENCLRAYQHLNGSGKLKLRVIKSIPLEFMNQAARENLKTGSGEYRFEIGPLKLFADGALGTRTAAILEAYNEEPENFGVLIKDNQELLEIGVNAVKQGFSLAVHAIGDRALNIVMKSYSDLFRLLPDSYNLPHKHRVEHVQMALPEDLDTFRDLQLIASVQPIHAPSDREMAMKYWGERTVNAYPLGTILNRGILAILGSDAPVENPNPFAGLASAVCRRSPRDLEPFHIKQAISIQQALECFCRNPHVVTGHQKELGVLKEGYLADFIILPVDPFAIDPIDLYNIYADEVFIAGEKVYER